jgi:hypothetical protein
MRVKPYSNEIETQMLKFYKSLSEKDRRHYAAIEATKLGYGGVSYISSVLKCNHEVITRGKEELKTESFEQNNRIRRVGGGRKSALVIMPGIGEAFLEVIDNSTAGSPMDETIKWTNLSRANIALRLAEKGFKVSVTVIDQLLKKYNFRPRKAFKSEAGKENIPNRDEQFRNIEKLRTEYTDIGNPVISMDVKKKS